MEAVSYHRLSRYKIRKIILCFTEDITATSASKILPINRNTINAYYNEIREKILQHSLREREKELGEFELDESCFGIRRVRGKKGWTAGKTTVFGLLKRNWKVFVTVVPNYSKEEPMPFIQGKTPAGSTLRTDGRKVWPLSPLQDRATARDAQILDPFRIVHYIFLYSSSKSSVNSGAFICKFS